MAAPLESGFTLVLAARGSGFGAESEATLVLACRGDGFVELPMFTAVLAARGFGLVGMSSGALLLPTGLSPTPDVFVFPKGFGCSGEELKFRWPLVVDGSIALAANSLVGELREAARKGIRQQIICQA